MTRGAPGCPSCTPLPQAFPAFLVLSGPWGRACPRPAPPGPGRSGPGRSPPPPSAPCPSAAPSGSPEGLLFPPPLLAARARHGCSCVFLFGHKARAGPPALPSPPSCLGSHLVEPRGRRSATASAPRKRGPELPWGWPGRVVWDKKSWSLRHPCGQLARESSLESSPGRLRGRRSGLWLPPPHGMVSAHRCPGPRP